MFRAFGVHWKVAIGREKSEKKSGSTSKGKKCTYHGLSCFLYNTGKNNEVLLIHLPHIRVHALYISLDVAASGADACA